MKCPSCNKFAGYDTGTEPEVELESTGDGAGVEVHGTVRIVLTSECCGDELKESTFEVSEVFDGEAVLDAIMTAAETLAGEDPEIEKLDFERGDIDLASIDWDEPSPGDFQVTDETQATVQKTLKNGTVKTVHIKPRYQKRFFGFEGTCSVDGSIDLPFICREEEGEDTRKGCSLTFSLSFDPSDKIQASYMDELT